MKIYVIHSIIPSYFSSAEKALKHAWGISCRPGDQNGPAERSWYIRTGKEALKANGIIKPDPMSAFPKITMEDVK